MDSKKTTKGIVLYVVNVPDFFVNAYLRMAFAARDAGYDVHVASVDGSAVSEIRRQGFSHHVFPMTRGGHNPFQELKTLYALHCLIRQIRPMVVHLVTIKPVLYGGMVSRFFRVPRVVASITGLGYVFTSNAIRARVLRTLVSGLYRIALNHPRARVVFLNADNRNTMIKRGLSARSCIVPGEGIDLTQYRYLPEPTQTKTVVMATRLLRDKGVKEYFEAATMVKAKRSEVRFILAGEPDPSNPESVTQEDLDNWNAYDQVDCIGFCADVAGLYAQSNIVVLPSYGEGLPRSLTEAAACGRSVVTTDAVGCREAIEPGKTGLLIPVRDAKALTEAVLKLIEDDELRLRMGKLGRERAEKCFDSKVIVGKYLNIYNGGGGEWI